MFRGPEVFFKNYDWSNLQDGFLFPDKKRQTENLPFSGSWNFFISVLITVSHAAEKLGQNRVKDNDFRAKRTFPFPRLQIYFWVAGRGGNSSATVSKILSDSEKALFIVLPNPFGPAL